MASAWAHLRWDPPTVNADSSPLTDLAGYRLYCSQATDGPFFLSADPGLTPTPEAPDYILVDFPKDGLWYFVVTAYDNSGNEGAASEQTSGTVLRPTLRLARSAR